LIIAIVQTTLAKCKSAYRWYTKKALDELKKRGGMQHG